MDRLGATMAGGTAAVLVLIAAAFALTAAPAGAARSMTRALTDNVWFYGSQWNQATTASGARLVLLEVDWESIEPKAPPPGIDPTDPAGPEYSFSSLDAAVRQVQSTGASVAFLVGVAPSWAETPGGPAAFEAAGAWEPNVTAYGQMATALARRYSGSYPDPLSPGRALPRARYYQAWGEANFSVHLAPQWVKSGGGWAPAAPTIYRNLLNAFYSGVKSVHSDNFVIATGFGPYGDPGPGACVSQTIGPGCRTKPALFAREMLCLQGQALKPQSCPSPAHFDALAIDPYEVGGPTTHAYAADDVSAPDLGKLTRIMNKAAAVGTALPRAHKQLWVTEFGYESRPPNPKAVSLAIQARWTAQVLYIFWTEGVSTAVWYQIRDPTATFSSIDYYTGLYFFNGRPKPAAEAFRFPFVVLPAGRKVRAWGISPRSGRLTVQYQRGRSWRTLFRVRVGAGGTFVRNISPRLHGKFRAVVGGESSVVWNR
jgi:hypothetical protein